MTPPELAYLLDVLRFQTLRHAPTRSQDDEWDRLRRRLEPVSAPSADAMPRPSWERRVATRTMFPMAAVLRIEGRIAPITILDLSPGGMRIHDELGLGHLEVDVRCIVSLEPRRSLLRIDVPVEVRHGSEDSREWGLQFRGAPLLLHQRLGHRRDLMRVRPADAPPPPAMPVAEPGVPHEIPTEDPTLPIAA